MGKLSEGVPVMVYGGLAGYTRALNGLRVVFRAMKLARAPQEVYYECSFQGNH